MNEDKIKKDLEEIETINIELDHRVSKLIAENEHLKQTYKQLYDSIKPARIRSKEQCDDLINQVNLKSVEISDLNASLQEKVLVITALKDDLRKLKGKSLVDNAVTKHTIDPEMLKIDVEPITPKLLNKRTAHSAYIKHTQEEVAVLRDLVDHVKANYPLYHSLESALAVTPKNKDKRVRFTEPERLLEQVINKDIVNIIMNSSVDIASVNVHECEKCLKLETELLNKKDFVEKEIYDKLFKSFTTLEKHCISLEVDTQLNQEIFQRDNSVSNQSAPSFDQLFELNELKAQSQEKDTVIKKLKERIKSLSGKMNEDKIKKDLEEIETINIELDHRVSKLIAENEHLKQTYKQLYDSIKPARIRSKEQCDDLINQVNLKSVEISDLNASLQEKVLVITALKDDLRKLKGKALVDNAVTKHTIDPEMLKIDVEPITPKLLNKKDLVESAKLKYPLDHSLESTCRYSKLIQELLTNISKTCPSINNTDGKLVAVTPKNKDKRVRFIEPVTPSGNIITKTASTSNLVSNKPMLSSTGVKLITTTTEVPLRKPTALENEPPKPVVTLVYSRKPRKSKNNIHVSKSKVLKSVIQIVLWYLDSDCSKHMTRDRSQLTNFVNKFLGTVKFRNDHVTKILGYGDYQIGNVTISRVYYVEGLGHNLFSVGQFCDSNLEVAFRQHTCFIRNIEGDDLSTGS
ncbi:hypothetical protein Tco_0452311 [Tanacetum coccineum]